MPAYGSSYDCSMYKRYMRSMSSSLSSSQNINNLEDNNLNDSFEDVSNFLNSNNDINYLPLCRKCVSALKCIK